MKSSRVLLCLLLFSGACAKRIPLPKHLEVSGPSELVQRMNAARSPVQKYFAEARLSYLGPQGRVKGTATLAVSRPSSFRYDLVGPHGSVVEAFATNGDTLQLFTPSENRFISTEASVANIDRLMAFAPLRLSPPEWVGLLFGEIQIPESAEVAYDDTTGRFVLSFLEGGRHLRVEVDPTSSQVTRAQILQSEEVVSDVVIEERDPKGIPTHIRMQAPAASVDLRASLRDIEHDPQNLGEDAFVLHPPRGITPQAP